MQDGLLKQNILFLMLYLLNDTRNVMVPIALLKKFG